jgi:hypothetical protein
VFGIKGVTARPVGHQLSVRASVMFEYSCPLHGVVYTTREMSLRKQGCPATDDDGFRCRRTLVVTRCQTSRSTGPAHKAA